MADQTLNWTCSLATLTVHWGVDVAGSGRHHLFCECPKHLTCMSGGGGRSASSWCTGPAGPAVPAGAAGPRDQAWRCHAPWDSQSTERNFAANCTCLNFYHPCKANTSEKIFSVWQGLEGPWVNMVSMVKMVCCNIHSSLGETVQLWSCRLWNHKMFWTISGQKH